MADEILLGSPELTLFNQSVQANDPYGLAGRSLLAWNPNYQSMNGTESGLTAFGKAFLGGFLQNYAQNRAADQMSKVVQVLPQLTSRPEAVATPEGVDPAAFQALRGGLFLNKAKADLLEKQENKKFNSDLLKTVIGEAAKNDPSFAAKVVEAAKTGDVSSLNASIADGGSSENPNSPQYKVKQDLKTQADSLRKEFQGKDLYSNYQTSLIGFKSLANALKDPAATSDLELVRGAIQAIEPGLAVREGEAAAVQNSASIPDAWKAAINKALNGESGLPSNVREGIMRIAARRYEQHASAFNNERTRYLGLAEGRQVNPGEVVLDPTAPSILDIYPEYKVPTVAPTTAGAVPPGMKMQYNPRTGEVRVVPK